MRLGGSLLQPFWPSLSQSARREIALRLLQRNAHTITFTRDNVHWSAPIQGAVTRDLFLGQEHQSENFGPLLQWLGTNSVTWSNSNLIINVGANIGDTAIALHRRTGRPVLAFEPVNSTFQHLQENVTSNGFGAAITCRRIAVAPTTGVVQIVLNDDPGLCEIYNPTGQGLGVNKDTTVETVECLPLDELADASGVALVWSDTQGFEASVIQSGASLWRAGVPLWTEVWPQGLEAHGGIDRFIDACTQHFSVFIAANHLPLDGMPQPLEGIAKV